MRFIEIQGGLQVPASNDELIVLTLIQEYREPFPKTKLNIREQELAKHLVFKGLIDRILIDSKVHFVYNDL